MSDPQKAPFYDKKCTPMKPDEQHRSVTKNTMVVQKTDTMGETIRCLRFAIFCWVEKHINIIKKTDELPNPRQEKLGLKVAFWAIFPTANIFSWVGIGFM